MKETFCPLCYTKLETRTVTPCQECGHLTQEVEGFSQNKDTFTEYEVLPSLKLVLCNFCAVDFGSHAPSIFGLPVDARLGFYI